MIDIMIHFSIAMAIKLSKHLLPTSRGNLEPYDYHEGRQLFSVDDSDNYGADSDGDRKKLRKGNHGDNDRRLPTEEHDSEFRCRRVIDAAEFLFDHS
jgi:hypothetical protein